MKTFCIFPVMSIITFFEITKGFNFGDKNIDQFQYSFHDASVPPPFHRSYTITVKSDSVHIIVSSYGNTITDTSLASTPEKLKNIVSLLDSGKVKNSKLAYNDGCTGGTGENILCTSKNVNVFSGNVYHCGGKDSGDLAGDYSLAVNAARALIPDIEGLMKR